MSCLYCETSCRWCDPRQAPPAVEPRARFPGATATQIGRIHAQRHPMGHAMPVEGLAATETCGSCAHLERHRSHSGAKRWFKCALTTHTGGLASDTRARWPACARCP